MSPTQIVVLVVLVALAVVAAVGFVVRRRRLQRRDGPEYNRVVAESDSRTSAEREPRDRERRHEELELTPLKPDSRSRYVASWQEIQGSFLDAPAEAVGAADTLVTQLIAERGYPVDDYEEQLVQLSVEHARTLGRYRDAHEIQLRSQRGETDTEQLRQALMHYRALFADLLGESPVPQHVHNGRSHTSQAQTGEEKLHA